MNKTLPTVTSVESFLQNIEDDRRQQDSRELVRIMQKATGAEPVMWGASIIGFGNHHYVYESGREGDIVAVGFSPRKTALVLYGVVYYEQNLQEVANLGKCKLGKGCLYIKSLADIDKKILSTMITKAYTLRNNQ